MFPSEMVILMAMAVNRHSGNKLHDQPMDITGEYVGYLYESLVRRGYLKGSPSKGYRLTPQGQESLAEFLRNNDTRVKDTINRLRQLGIKYSLEMDRLGRHLAGVR